MRFYLGTHKPIWLERLGVPLFVSHRSLVGRATLPRAIHRWALDSGGFSELSLFGQWRTTPADYVRAVRLYRDEIGNLDWAAPQDWMVEPFMLRRTGLTMVEHQRRTVDNYLTLRSLDAQLPFIPVIQGQSLDDYRLHVAQYQMAGIDLTAEPVVGIGSVCRRQSTNEIGTLVANLTAEGLALHGFGMKSYGLARVGPWLASADSLAWSYEARRCPRMAGCQGHAHCNNCPRYALAWRARLLANVRAIPAQLSL